MNMASSPNPAYSGIKFATDFVSEPVLGFTSSLLDAARFLF